ncbi:MAG TPA: RNA polymerase subunit sigma-70, partial [Candidatus Dormibacteraeota bacterium]|nr:RNA polymerase subunit sigma-70 [Candidatus Dormibacteraeota bacterium]
AARGGDFEAPVGLLDSDVVRRVDFGARHPALWVVTRGAAEVARSALRAAHSMRRFTRSW